MPDINIMNARYIQLNPRTGGTAPGTPAILQVGKLPIWSEWIMNDKDKWILMKTNSKPTILQSLLGHNSGREFLQLTSGGHGLNVGR